MMLQRRAGVARDFIDPSLWFDSSPGAEEVGDFAWLTSADHVHGGRCGEKPKRLSTGTTMVLGLSSTGYHDPANPWMVAVMGVLNGESGYTGGNTANFDGVVSGWRVDPASGSPKAVFQLADSTGDYQLGFTIIAGLALFGNVFWYLAKPPRALSELSDAQQRDVAAG